MTALRVLVVEDSLTIRRHLVDVLGAAPDVQVVGEAEDGARAIELARALRPDVITLDMMLPVMSGVAVTEYVMAFCPTPILIVSSSLNRGEVYKTYDALAAGAVDVFEKPRGDARDEGWEQRLVAAVRLVSRIKVITHLRGKLGGARDPRPPAAPVDEAAASRPPRAVAIGASTGGPAAIVAILRQLPALYPVPILLALHISQPFGDSFAGWLDGLAPLPVRSAVDGEPLPPPGTPGVVIAPPDRHLVVAGGRLRLTRDPARHSCRPSVDALFESVARELGAEAVGCLLTGMGRDGAAGLLALRQAGALTVAQDEASCVVFGMPREAIALGAAARVAALAAIGPLLAELGRSR
jgi:two-component system, chemotaxis family, protein-glutamate methylesterase/glutaminase